MWYCPLASGEGDRNRETKSHGEVSVKLAGNSKSVNRTVPVMLPLVSRLIMWIILRAWQCALLTNGCCYIDLQGR